MAKLTFIDVYPQTGFFDGLWEASEPLDAVARTARRVCEAHNERLRQLDLQAPRANYRLLPRDADGADAMHVELIDDLAGHNIGILHVPVEAHRWTPQPRAAAILDAIHQTAVLLGQRLGWDLAALRRIREEVASDGAQYCWESAWKASRRHSSRARVRAMWHDDGFGRLSVEVDTPQGSLFSVPVVASSTPEGLKRAADTLAWQPGGAMWILPNILPFGIPAAPPATIPDDELTGSDPLPSAAFEGQFIAPVPLTADWQADDLDRLANLYVSTGSDASGTPRKVDRAVDRVNDDLPELLADWLREAGVLDLEWNYSYDRSAKTLLRIVDKRPKVIIWQQRTKADLADPDTCETVLFDDLQRALDRLATKLGHRSAPHIPR